MAILLIPIFIIVAIATFSVGGDLFSGINIDLPDILMLQNTSVATSDNRESPTTYTAPAPTSQAATFILDTKITVGPKEGSTIEETNSVTFEFEGSIIPQDRVRITYETYIAGIDEYWKPTTSAKRTIKLPTGPKQYTFLVRSKYKGERDYTPASRTFITNTSPYYGKVDISSVRKGTSSSKLLITLRPKLSTGEEINLTGWRIEGELGGFDIPLGIEEVPVAVNFTPLDHITIHRGDTVYLSAEKSPFGKKVSFKPNICMGYLKQYYTFPLSVPSSCPDKPTERELRYFRVECQDFILHDINFSSCTVPSHANNAAVATDSECLSYIENHFNYRACSILHKNDSDYLKNTWHVYMETDFTRDRHDTLKLLDKDRRIVDTYLW